jgi:hypothetical protein
MTDRAQVLAQRALLVSALLAGIGAAVSAVFAQAEAPNYLTSKQRDRAGVPRIATLQAQEAPPESPRYSEALFSPRPAEGTLGPLATSLDLWASALEAGLAVEDPGVCLETVGWQEQLALLRRAAEVIGCDESVERSAHQPEGPMEAEESASLADMFRGPESEAELQAYVSDCQAVAAEITRTCPGAQAEHVRIVAQEFSRIRVLASNHPASRQRYRMLVILKGESKCCPTAMGRAGDAGLFQFIPSTCRWLGLDYAKMHSATPDAIRYQCRAAFRLLGMKPGGYWTQWSTDQGPDGRDGGR